MTLDRPAPGSHDRTTPTGTLEESSANLFEAMLAARDAEGRDEAAGPALEHFYRTLMTGTLLLPVPPEHGEEARRALEAAVNDDQEVEVSVLLATDADGQAVSVCFASVAALAAWAPRGTATLPLPARIAVANMAAAGVPAILDPAGPIPYRFEPDELADLAAGRLPGTDRPLFETAARRSLRLRLPGAEAMALEASLAQELSRTDVEAAWLVESESDGQRRLLLGLLGPEGASATVDVPDGTDVVWLEEPLLSSVRAVAEPFYRRGGRR
ncbi:MAG TPA: SseB family protein [candidate division Zixibacteria bacterium]|nr:SseB family protein [candidate division Zixibacteria bacterium]